MPKFIVQHAKDNGEFEELCTREYADGTPIPESGQIIEIPGIENDEGEPKTFFIENLGQRLAEGDQPEYMLLVKDADQVRAEIEKRRKQEMRRIQKMQQQQMRGQGGGGGGQGGGSGSPFTLG